AIILLGVAIAFEQGTNRWAFRRRNVEMLTQGDLALLAEDGRLRVDVMKREGISRERVFAALRASGIEQIGQVRCVYLEASGQFSLFRAAQRRPGLSLFPARDAAVRAMQPVAFGAFACGSCGYVERHERTPDFRCRYCGSVQWTPAVWDVQESSSNADADGGPNDQRLTERKKSQGPPQSARQ
ncbi:MAG TPA: YetF domain-containing protein, partial [Myxococcaceae bacterium]|nr:YetF domain-containing protein [Myxococcaceae bacterium]